MKRNMSVVDRTIRVLIAAVVAVLYFTHVLSPMAGLILGILAVIFVVTSVVGFCPLYAIFGISTKKKAAA
jgi:hypothetical protein